MGAYDHMTVSLKNMVNIRTDPTSFKILLPVRDSVVISHICDVRLKNGLKLSNVLYVTQFTHNVLYTQTIKRQWVQYDI